MEAVPETDYLWTGGLGFSLFHSDTRNEAGAAFDQIKAEFLINN
jgi:hypothetical protein